jgi:methyltransferase-like protein/SAM-dependent methyltransferase
LQTHPDRLAAVGTLFGMSPAPVRGCRVLEIGCGDASNLIPMAYALPESRFTGIDLAEEPVASGRRTVAALGLDNISLVAGDLREVGSEYGEFDYILAHGVYSWIPRDVRESLMAVCAERLAPQGIAFISYNAYPGSHARQMLREMMLYHTRSIVDPTDRIEQARWFLRFLLEGRFVSPGWQTWLDEEVKSLLDRGADALYHDELEETNEPVYFRHFIEHAGRYGLQYLGEAEPHVMFDPEGAVAWIGDDVLKREQYLDFLRGRRFRQTLLCRDGIVLRRPATPEHMEPFLFSAPATPAENGHIKGLRGISITSAHEAVYRVASALGETYPLPLAFDELVPYAGGRGALQEILFGLATGGFANIHVFDFPCEETVTAKPKASRLARHQASLSRFVTSACHHTVEVDDVGRLLLLLMDGTRDHEQLAQDLAAIPGTPPLEKIRVHLPTSLEWLAGMALLEG